MAIDPIILILQKIEETVKGNLLGVVEYIEKFSHKHASEIIDEVEVSDFDNVADSIKADFMAGAAQLAMYLKVKIEFGATIEDIKKDCDQLVNHITQEAKFESKRG